MSETKEVPKGVSWKAFVAGIAIVFIISPIYSLSWPPANLWRAKFYGQC